DSRSADAISADRAVGAAYAADANVHPRSQGRALLGYSARTRPRPPQIVPVGPCGRTSTPMTQQPSGHPEHPAPRETVALTDLPVLRVAVLGAGTVGAEVLRLLSHQGDDLAHRIGGRLEVVGVSVRALDRDRGEHVPAGLLTEDAHALVRDVDLVVEVMVGIEPARSLLLEAMANGASVVTANKALLAQDGATLYEAADAHGVDLHFEAAVAGAIPLVRPVRESLAGDRIQRVMGIVNGTTNFILDAMTRTGADFDDALATAQE